MANNLTNYLENKLLDHFLGTTSFTMPTQVYVALLTAASDQETPTLTEVSGGSYARQAVDFDAAASGATQNAAEITFPTATANWGTVTHVALYDASSTGNALMVGALTSSKTVNTGDTFRIADGDLDVSID